MDKRYEVGDWVKIRRNGEDHAAVIIGFDNLGSDDKTVQEYTLAIGDDAVFTMTVADLYSVLAEGKPSCPVCKGSESPQSKDTADGQYWSCHECGTKWYPKPMGRPSIGVTRKQSLTLPQDTWDWIDLNVSNGHASSRSEFLRQIIEFEQMTLRR